MFACLKEAGFSCFACILEETGNKVFQSETLLCFALLKGKELMRNIEIT